MTRILVRPPALEDIPSWLALGWRTEPDPIGLADEHARFRAALETAGAEVIEARGEPGNLDSIYVYDPVLVTRQGAILLQPGKLGRRGEPEALSGDLPLPVLGRLEGNELAEGGDTVWLDERTLLVGPHLPHERCRDRRASPPPPHCRRARLPPAALPRPQ